MLEAACTMLEINALCDIEGFGQSRRSLVPDYVLFATSKNISVHLVAQGLCRQGEFASSTRRLGASVLTMRSSSLARVSAIII